jgi:hypothetical protein
MPEGEGWRTPDNPWLEMEEEDEGKIFHFNGVIKVGEPRDRRVLAPACLSNEEEYATWSLRREQERNK